MFHGFKRRSGAVGDGNECSDAGSRDDIDRNAGFTEDAEHTDVSDAPSKTTGEGNAHTRAPAALRSSTVGEGAEQLLGHAHEILRVSVFFRSHSHILRRRAITKRLFDPHDSIL